MADQPNLDEQSIIVTQSDTEYLACSKISMCAKFITLLFLTTSMREIVFAMAYPPDCDQIADTLADYPDVQIRSQACHVTEDSLWRIDHATGPADALTALEEQYLAPDYCADCLVSSCDSDGETQVLDRSDNRRIFYIRWSKTENCTSIPHLALEQFGTGLLFETTRVERQYQWRILVPDEANLSTFHTALDDTICECAEIDLRRIQTVESWTASPADRVSLSDKQQAALTAAVEHGYYETPRSIELGELADNLGIPRSTLSYRLRRAEAQLATAVAETQTSHPTPNATT